MPVGEEDPKIAVRNELNRRDTQQFLRELRGKEGIAHNTAEYKAGHDYAFKLSDEQRNEVLKYVEMFGCSVHEAMQALKLVSE